MNYPHLAARVFNTPLLIHPGKLDAILAGLGQRLLGIADADGAALAAAFAQARLQAAEQGGPAPELFSTRRGERVREAGWPGYQVVDGVAVVPITGTLVHRTRLDADSSLLQGYNDMAGAVEHAMDNPDVHAVLQVYDSPGGEVQGAFEFAQRMCDQRGKKPMKAIADGMSASAAYLGASAADELAITRTGYAGSIGVVMRHVDFSRALANDGITVTHIFAGAHKVDANQFAPLPDAVRADLQAEIDDIYGMFVQAVVAHRPNLSEEAVRNTEARTYRGVAALAAGLADRIATTDQLITELAGLRARSYPVGQPARATTTAITGDHTMTGTTTPAGASQQPAALTQADLDAARAEGREAGIQAERGRVSAILGHETAAAHPALARQCIDTGLTAEQAAAILGAAPKAAPAAGANAFAAVMAGIGNPGVSGVEAGSGSDNTEAALAGQILAAFRGTAGN